MQEDLKKNFILLSKIAKEKKYAQEYMGLLARRGDIGSIRIGKRWYTTWGWFEEFLENSQKKSSFAKAMEDKKQIVSEAQIAEPVVVEEPAFAKATAGDVKINVPFVFPEREKVSVVQPVVDIQREEKISEQPRKISVMVKTRNEENFPVKSTATRMAGGIREMRGAMIQPKIIQARKFAPVKKMQPILQDEPKLRNPSVEEKNRYAVPYQEIKFKKKKDIFSPDFAGEEKMAAPVFGRFAFAMSFAAIFLLVAASGYFVWSGGLLTKGQVAGASDERNVGFSGITSGGEYVLVSAGDKMKESLSISRVMVEAAKEKDAEIK